jgi:hypothetical protein
MRLRSGFNTAPQRGQASADSRSAFTGEQPETKASESKGAAASLLRSAALCSQREHRYNITEWLPDWNVSLVR